MKLLFSSVEHIPEIFDGDCLIVKDNYNYMFYFQINGEKKLIETAKTIKIYRNIGESTVVIDYADMKQLNGDIQFIKFLLTVFSTPEVKSYLNNALNILSFADNKWDAAIIQNLISYKPAQVSTIHRMSFIDYLGEKEKVFCVNLLESGLSPKEAFRKIKDEYPSVFSKALKLFKRDNPNLSIFD